MSKDKIIIPYKERMIILNFEEFEDEIDIDDLTRIDYSNLHAELLTIPSIMNRVGLWMAMTEREYQNAKMDHEIYCAKRYTAIKKVLKTVKNSKGDLVKKEKTIAEIEAEVLLDEGVQLRRNKMLDRQQNHAYMDSLYWAVKSKETKLNKIGEKMNLTPEEFEKNLVEGKWNGILIRSKEKLIKD